METKLVIKYTLPNGKELTQEAKTIEAGAKLVVRSEMFKWGFTDFQVLKSDGSPACEASEWAAAVKQARSSW